MTLASQIVSDVEDVFFNTSDFAVSVTYTRGASSVTLTAIVEPSLFDNNQALGITRVETRGYLIPASDLILGGSATLPIAGDKITEGTRTYIVPKTRDEPTYEYADENRLILRVNTTYNSKTA